MTDLMQEAPAAPTPPTPSVPMVQYQVCNVFKSDDVPTWWERTNA